MTLAEHTFSDQRLTIDTLCALAHGPVAARFDAAGERRIARGRTIVEDVLRSGVPIYATTTGVGSQKGVAVGIAQLADFSDRMIISEATLAPGEDFSEEIVRAALLILCQNFAHGSSGISPALARRLLALLAETTLPKVRRDCAFGVADLTPLSQLALPLIGAVAGGIRLKPKESVSLIDNNSFGLAEAAFALRDARSLLHAFDVAAAAACEGFRAGLTPHSALAAGGARSAGQTLARDNLHRLLAGSALHDPKTARFLQDPLSFRGLTQVNGAAYEALDWAVTQVQAEINAPTDNPLVDFDNCSLATSASMISLLPPLALDCLRQAVTKVAITSHERSLKLQSPPFSGLPAGLAIDGAPDGGILSINLHYIGAARLGTMTAAAAPVTLHYVGHTADGVEDVSTLLPLSVAQTLIVIERGWELAVLEMIVAVWAIARRKISPLGLGVGPRFLYEQLIDELHIGEEGVRVFDLTAIIRKVKTTNLVERSLNALM